jgi:hypothetical protein
LKSSKGVKKIFKPSKAQAEFLEAYLNQETRKTIEELCSEAKVDRTTYYYWIKKPEFNEWFYNQIELNKYRYAPRIMDNIFTKAMGPNATTQDKELALRVLRIYTPTQKNINENHDFNYEAELEKIINKAKELLEN